MSLASRLSWFFLAALALVLAGFSATLYALAHSHLHRQQSERLQAALNTLVAAAEIESGAVEWEPRQRLLDVSPVLWEVADGNGQRIDGSGVKNILRAVAGGQTEEEVVSEGQRWRVLRRRLQAEGPERASGAKKHAALVITVAAPLGPVQATLRWLALVLTGLSVGLWAAAAVAGRWLCRRGLRPLADMAGAARAITAADLTRRLPAAGTADELDELGSAFNDLLSRLEESFARQQRFTGDASHQLRTPLAAMLGQVEVALRRDRAPDDYRRVLGLVQGQAGQLRQLVEALLFLARANAEAAVPELEPVDLRRWLAAHLASWESHPRAADLRRAFSADDSSALWVRVHPALFGQALDNLLDNACKYSAPGSPVAVRIWEEGGMVCLGVEDQGDGIAAEDLPHVFEPFYRSPAARRSAGVGLGLAVAGRIVASLGGRIEATSAPGKGCLCTIRLPGASDLGTSREAQRPSSRQEGG